MTAGALFVKYWEKEGAATRKVLSRIPEGSDFRPDPKSRPAREIAWLIVREEIALGDGLRKKQMEWADVPAPATMKEVLAEYDRHHDRITAEFRAMNDAAWDAKVPFMYEGKVVMNETAYDSAFGFLFDIIHHRGQITTYLRAMASTVPAIYGPSADEAMG